MEFWRVQTSATVPLLCLSPGVSPGVALLPRCALPLLRASSGWRVTALSRNGQIAPRDASLLWAEPDSVLCTVACRLPGSAGLCDPASGLFLSLLYL